MDCLDKIVNTVKDISYFAFRKISSYFNKIVLTTIVFTAHHCLAIDVTTQTELETALLSLPTASANVVINFTAPITLTRALPIVHMNSTGGFSATINGSPTNYLDGANLYRGLLVNKGTVIINDLQIQNTIAKGGTSRGSGGGGAGLGGGLFVNDTAVVTINNVSFVNNISQGGQSNKTTATLPCGGGGMGGDAGGGVSGLGSTGGGGLFSGAGGDALPAPGPGLGGGGGGGGGMFGNGGSSNNAGGGGGGMFGNGGSAGNANNLNIGSGGGGGGGTSIGQNGAVGAVGNGSSGGKGGGPAAGLGGGGAGNGGVGTAGSGGGGGGGDSGYTGSDNGGSGGNSNSTNASNGGGGGGGGAKYGNGGSSTFGGGGGGGGAGGNGGNGGFGGGGGGGGQSAGNANTGNGGNGGFGGGGGGTTSQVIPGNTTGGNGGAGGFGGGGGGVVFNNAIGGAGGFGGGGGASLGGTPGVSGFGAGVATNSQGGGGASLGGAIFVHQGGSLIIQGNTTTTNSTATASGGKNGGFAYGSAMFLQGTGTQTFSPGVGNTQSITGVIADQSGNGGTGIWGLSKTGTGTLNLSGINTYSGSTTVSGGILGISSDSNLGSTASTLSLAGGTLASNANFTLPTTRTVTIANGRLSSNNSTFTIASTITGTGGLTTSGGTGRLILTAANTYTGGTNLQSGIVQVSADSNLGNSAGAVTFNGGTLRLGANLNLGATRAISVNANNGTFDTNTFNSTISQIISGSGNFNKAGSGTLILTGANTYAGDTTISEGTLQVGNNGTTGSILNNVNNNGNLTFNRSDATSFSGVISGNGSVTKQGALTLTLLGNNTYTGNTIISNGILQIGNNGTTGSIAGNVSTVAGTSLTFSRSDNIIYGGVISGAGSVLKTSAGTTILTNNNTYTGGTTISTGSLQIGNGGTTGSITGNVANSGNINFNRININTYTGVVSGSGSLTQSGTGTTVLTNTNTYTGGTSITAGTLQIGNGSTTGSIAGDVVNTGNLSFNRSDNYTYGGVVSDTGTVEKNGSGNVILIGNNTYTGLTSINSGNLQIGNGSTTGNIASDVAAAINTGLIFNRSNSVTFANVLSGLGGLSQAGTGTTILTGTNTYTGGTNINTGTLQIGDGATTGSIVGNVNNQAALNFNRSDATSYAGVISGSGTVNKQNTNTLTFTGENTYTGTTTVTAGILQIGNGGTSGSITSNVNNSGAVNFNRSDALNFGGVISGAGSVHQIGTGITNLTAVNTYTGTTFLQNGYLQINNDSNLGNAATPLVFDGGALQFGTAFNLNNAHSITITAANGIINTNGFDTTISQGITGSGSLNKIGTGTLTLTGANSYNDTTISDGIMQIGDGGTAGSVTGSVLNNSNLTFNRSDAITYGDLISGSGSVTKLGNDILTLTNDNAYTGTTTIASGTLQIGNGGTTGSVTGNILNNSNLIFNRDNTLTYAGSISGLGTVSQNGTGTLSLSANNSYTGGTFLNAGITNVTADSNLGDIVSPVFFNSGALQLGSNVNFDANRSMIVNTVGTFDTNGFNSTLPQTLTGAIGTSFIKTGTGNLNITGNSTGFLSDVIINQGGFGLNGTIGGNVTVNNGTLYGTGTTFGNATINGGIIAPGNSIGILHFNGNYIQNPASTYLVEVNSTTSDLIDVDGTATINGGTVQVFTLSEPSIDKSYVILHADGGISGTYDTLKLPNNFFEAILTYNPFDIFLGIAQNFINGAQTQNQISIANQLNNVENPSPRVKALFDSLFSQTDDQVRHVLDLLAGSQYTHLLQVSQYSAENFSRRIWDNLRNRKFTANCENICCDTPFRTWFDVDVRNAFQKGNQEAKGYRLDSHDLLAGIEKQINTRFIIGSTFDYENDYLHFNLSGHGRAHTYQGALYALYTAPKHYFFSDLIIGHRTTHLKRHIDSGAIHLTARSKADMWQSQLYNEIGLNFQFGALLLQPFGGVEVGHYNSKHIKEHGVSSFDLIIKGQNRFTTNSRLGLHFRTDLPFGIAIGGDIAWKHRFNFVDDHFKTRFKGFGTDFSILGVKRNRDSIEGNINMSQTLNDYVEVYVDVFGQRESRYSAYGVAGGFTIEW